MRPANLRFPMAFLAACAAAASARPGPAAPGTCPAIDPPAAAVSAGVRAFVDPATGKLRPPTAEERRQLAGAVDRSARTYEVVVRPDGTRLVELDDAFFMSVVATKRTDGTLKFRCLTQRPAPAGEVK
jgi:hypothetical protein